MGVSLRYSYLKSYELEVDGRDNAAKALKASYQTALMRLE